MSYLDRRKLETLEIQRNNLEQSWRFRIQKQRKRLRNKKFFFNNTYIRVFYWYLKQIIYITIWKLSNTKQWTHVDKLNTYLPANIKSYNDANKKSRESNIKEDDSETEQSKYEYLFHCFKSYEITANFLIYEGQACNRKLHK